MSASTISWPMTDEVRAAMADYLAGHQRGRLGRIATSCEMFGLDEDFGARFAPYAQHFWREGADTAHFDEPSPKPVTDRNFGAVSKWSDWFDRYLDTFTACARGDPEIGRLVGFYAVPW